MFYFDERLQEYEQRFAWDSALSYLEDKFVAEPHINILNSLIGFSWYYLTEGPLISKKFCNDPNTAALGTWKKYIDIGLTKYSSNPYFNFIAGYTLSFNGFYISNLYESKASILMRNCFNGTSDMLLKQLSDNFLRNEKGKKYIPLKNGKVICSRLFSGNSLL